MPLILEIGSIYITIVFFLGCDVISVEIKVIFPIKPFFYMNKKLKQKIKHLENEKSFLGEINSSFLKGFQPPKMVPDLRVRLYVWEMLLRLLYRDLQKQPPEVFYEKVVLKNFTKFTGKHLCQSLFLNKVAGVN